MTAANEIHITRLYDAPVNAVWDAWTDLEQVAQWWGPRGFTITTHSKELKPGGHWRYTMHGPDGVDYPNTTLYHEVVKGKRLVYDHGGSDERPPLFKVTVEFKEVGGKTQMDMTMALPTPEAATETRAFIKKAGGNGTWDRLAEYLGEQGGKTQFVIARSFACPLELMFDMWTDPKQLVRWAPPAGSTMEFKRADIRVGHGSFYVMTGPMGTMYGRSRYISIEKPDRIVYTQQFCDDQENVTRHPMAPTWPETMVTTVDFAAEAEGTTRVTVTWEPVEGSSPEEIATFVNARAGMTMGWTGSFDKLEVELGGADSGKRKAS